MVQDLPALVRPGLYLGSSDTEEDAGALASCGITHILQVATDMEPTYPESHTYHQVPMLDDEGFDLVSQLPECFQFINTARAVGGTVLVHCIAGVSRSAAVVIARLMLTESLPYSAAFDQVTAARPVVQPNPGFRMQLQQLELLQCDLGRWPGWNLMTYLNHKFPSAVTIEPPSPHRQAEQPAGFNSTTTIKPPHGLTSPLAERHSPSSTLPATPADPQPAPGDQPKTCQVTPSQSQSPSPSTTNPSPIALPQGAPCLTPIPASSLGRRSCCLPLPPPPPPPLPKAPLRHASHRGPSTSGTDDRQAAAMAIQPSLIRPGLYLSGAAVEQNYTTLKHCGITHILQVASEMKPSFPDDFKYLSLPVQDTIFQDLVPHLEACLQFIDAALTSGGTVLVHCMMGMSRSASAVIAYIMWKERRSFVDSLKQVTAARRVVSPNKAFRRQLQLLEELRFDFGKWQGWDPHSITHVHLQHQRMALTCCWPALPL